MRQSAYAFTSKQAETETGRARLYVRRPPRCGGSQIENHAAAVALYFMYYNFGRVHQTLRVTPAMEAGVSDHVWSIEEIVRLLEPEAGR